MTPTTRHIVLMLTLVALLAGFGFWSHGQMTQAHQRALAQANRTQVCRDLADAIEVLRRPATLTDTADAPLEQIQQLVVAAALAAGLSPEFAVLGIEPRVGRPLKDRPQYTRHTTELRLKPMTREQLARFIHHLVRANQSIDIDTLHLSFEGNRNVTPQSIVLAYLVPTNP